MVARAARRLGLKQIPAAAAWRGQRRGFLCPWPFRSSNRSQPSRLAVAADISAFTYRKLEKGESNPGTPANPRLKTLVALAEVLGVELVELLPPKRPRGVAVGR